MDDGTGDYLTVFMALLDLIRVTPGTDFAIEPCIRLILSGEKRNPSLTDSRRASCQ